ncbi:DNA-3-methyladenine glycosylase family protein [Actinoplanes sp. HUAS TT8]|uniref:DNA-3-methyladenine glycosylase family protein n=1 Tax=Actinoplanes sp. HUAS TT8 TaxID=3447453 RepID=UPI003F51DBE1
MLLPYRAPMRFRDTLAYLRFRAVPAVEAADDDSYTRTLCAPGGPARFTVTAATTGINAAIRVSDPGDLSWVTARITRLLDLDADAAQIDETLARDPAIARMVTARPGLRSPGAVDGFEIAVRGIIGQQISVAAARTRLQIIVSEHGRPAFADEPLTMFPSPQRVAAIDPETLGMPRARARTLIGVAQACADGQLCLQPGADPAEQRARLIAMPGIGPWTADYIIMRALAHPDILLSSDLGVRRSAERHGIDLHAGRPDLAPWRSYLSNHLWAASHDT